VSGGLQTHKKEEKVAVPGSRTAINISGVSVSDIQRGDVVVHPGDYEPTRRIDVCFRMLKDVKTSLTHNTIVKLFLGASETLARVRLLGVEQLSPGESGWLQLEPQKPVVGFRGDHYILRRPSPSETLGGGVIIDPYATKRYKRFDKATIKRLEALLDGDPKDLILIALGKAGMLGYEDLRERTDLSETQLLNNTKELISNGEIVVLDGVFESPSSMHLILAGKWKALKEELLGIVSAYHKEHPLRTGIVKEEIKSRMNLDSKLFDSLLNNMMTDGVIVERGGNTIALMDFRVEFSDDDEKLIEQLLERFNQQPFSPPTKKECVSLVGDDIFFALVNKGILVKVSVDIVFEKNTYQRMVEDIVSIIKSQVFVLLRCAICSRLAGDMP